MDKVLKELRDRPITLVIFVLIIIFIIAFTVDRLFLAGRRKKESLPCYNQKILVWSPYSLIDFKDVVKPLEKLCLKFTFEKKDPEEIANNLLLEIGAGKGPDIVYVDNEFFKKNSKIFEPYKGQKIDIDDYPENITRFLNNKLSLYPLTFDTLVLFYNKKYLANFGLYEPPQKFEEIEQIIPQFKNYNYSSLSIAPIALGKASNVDNFIEIFLVIHRNLNQVNYKNSSAFIRTLDYLSQFSDFQNSLYSWDESFPNSTNAFSQEKLAFLINFYSQKEKIRKANSRLDFSWSNFPKFQQSFQKYNYLKVFYLGVIKNKKSQYSWMFLEELDKRYKDFVKKNNLLPIKKSLFSILSNQEKILVNELLVGDYFEDVNYDYFKNNLARYLDNWSTNKQNLQNRLSSVDIFKFFKK
jgi:ABC-type glycerol-3-phosphate transport system substrate-binding protein